MTKVMIDVPDSLHRLVKTVAGFKGETMRNFILRATTSLIAKEAKIKDKITYETISEKDVEKLLKPYLASLIKNVKNGKEKTLSSKDFFAKL